MYDFKTFELVICKDVWHKVWNKQQKNAQAVGQITILNIVSAQEFHYRCIPNITIFENCSYKRQCCTKVLFGKTCHSAAILATPPGNNFGLTRPGHYLNQWERGYCSTFVGLKFTKLQLKNH